MNELISRYIYAVMQKLPIQKKEDVEKELNGLIQDRLESRTKDREANKEDVEEVLLELGHPSELANNYRENKRYLMSPELFTNYLSVLKIVLISVGITMSILFVLESIMNPTEVLKHFTDNLVWLILGCFLGLAWVTAIFAIMEYLGVRKDKMRLSKGPWHPTDLPPLPDRRNYINRFNPIASIFFTILIAVVVTYSIDLLGVWVGMDGEMTVIPFFDTEIFRLYLPFILIILALMIFKDSLKWILRKLTGKLIAFEMLLLVGYFVLAYFMFSNQDIWNPDFQQQLAQTNVTPTGIDSFRIVERIWDLVTQYTIIIIGVILVARFFSLLLKTFKLFKK